MPATATATKKIDATTAQAIRAGLYGAWRMWRQNPSTSEMLSAASLLTTRPRCEDMADIHYVIWQQDFHAKRLRKAEGVSSARNLENVRELTVADSKIWDHILRYRPRLGKKDLTERLDVVLEDPGYNSFRPNSDDSALVTSQVGREAAPGRSAPPK